MDWACASSHGKNEEASAFCTSMLAMRMNRIMTTLLWKFSGDSQQEKERYVNVVTDH